MKNEINLPGFTAEVNLNKFFFGHSVNSFGSDPKNGSAIHPQFFEHYCGPCVNGKRLCTLFGSKCTSVTHPGNRDLDIPPYTDTSCQPYHVTTGVDCISKPSLSKVPGINI